MLKSGAKNVLLAGKITLIFAIFLSLVSCQYSAKKRNHIHFKAPLDEVVSSMKRVNQLIMKIDCEDHYGYNFHDHGYLYICGQMIPFEKDNSYKKFRFLHDFTQAEFEEFIREISFLEDQKIYSCAFDPAYDSFIYSWRRTKEVRSNYYRALVLKPESLNKLQLTFTVLDEQDELLLLKRK